MVASFNYATQFTPVSPSEIEIRGISQKKIKIIT